MLQVVTSETGLGAISSWILPIFYGVVLWSGLLLLWRLLRQIKLLRGLQLTSRLLAFMAGLTLFLHMAGLQSSGLRNGLLLTDILLLTMVLLHIGESLVLLPYQKQGSRVPIPRLMRDIVKAVLLIFALMLTISQLFQIELGTVLVSSTVFTAVVGLALQDLLKNVFAGIALQLERPFEPGDWISVDGQEGQVLEMSWRAIRLRTRDWYQIILPSGVVAQQRVNNYTGMTARHLKLPIDGSYQPNRVKAVLKAATIGTPGVVAPPEPLVRVVQFSAATTVYDIKFWLQEYDRLPDIESDVMTNIWYHLHREKLIIANNETVWLSLHDVEGRLAPTPPETTAEALRTIDLFSALSSEEINLLARRAQVALYGAGEVLTHQGVLEDTLFVLREGLVRVEIAGHNGDAPVLLKQLGPGKIFGEFGLLTGEARSATVVAQQDTVAIVINRNDLAPLLARNPALPEALGKVLARRVAERTELLEARRNPAAAEEIPTGSKSLTRRIRNLFGLSGKMQERAEGD